MKMMVSTEDLQFTWTLTHGGTLLLSLSEVIASVYEQKNLHTDLIWDENQNALNESTLFYTKTTRSPLVLQLIV